MFNQFLFDLKQWLGTEIKRPNLEISNQNLDPRCAAQFTRSDPIGFWWNSRRLKAGTKTVRTAQISSKSDAIWWGKWPSENLHLSLHSYLKLRHLVQFCIWKVFFYRYFANKRIVDHIWTHLFKRDRFSVSVDHNYLKPKSRGAFQKTQLFFQRKLNKNVKNVRHVEIHVKNVSFKKQNETFRPSLV